VAFNNKNPQGIIIAIKVSAVDLVNIKKGKNKDITRKNIPE
jgi:hypothetical protein